MIEIASVANLRDLGGAMTASGGRVKRGLLYRSSHFGELTADEAQALAALCLRTVVDLRGATERERMPGRLSGDGLRHVHLPIEPRALGALRERRAAGELNEAAVVEIMFEVYRRFVHQHVAVFSSLLQLLLDDATALPLAFHCTAGKDRTGYAAALVLSALGVPRDTVIAEYMLSDGRWKPENPSSDWAVLSSVRAEYLQCAFDEMENGWGSVQGYLEGRLGLDRTARERLRERLVEGG